jgi:5-methylcytosine-specific restriction endonuclease McrA
MLAVNPIKTCLGCQDPAVRAELPIEQQCSACRKRERHRLWRLAHPGAMAANARRWREAGNTSVRLAEYAEQHRERERQRYQTDAAARERIKAAAKARRERIGAEVLVQANREWRHQNPEKVKAARIKREAKLSPETRQEKGRQHRERYRVQRQAGQAAYYARRYGGTGVISNEHLVSLHRWQDHCCFYCRSPLKDAETIEHVVPLSRGGSNNPWNVTLACSDCNTKKNNRIFAVEWQPANVQPPLRFHSVYGTGTLRQRLSAMGIAFSDQGDHLLIRERPVFVLSSFWLGWSGGAPVANIKARYPNAILFFDKEFARRPEAAVNVLKAKAGIAQRVGARKLRLEEPTSQEAQAFIGRWHAMGAASGAMYLGLRDDADWWVIAAFRKEIDRYEVIRMAIRETVAGGVSRIMAHFRERMPEQLPIIAFTDQRMGDGKSHSFAGFTEDGTTERSFFYATLEHDGFHARRDFQKQVLEAKGEYFDPEQTQVMIAKANGLMRVEGLPRLRFVLR